ncbi:MAG: hypothetical protein VW268_10020 [Rhodospirillaceae bacterium]
MSRQTTIMAVILASFMSLALFMISYQVQDLEGQLEAINRDIDRDSRTVRVLQAEWAHLNDPQRLRELAQKYLGLSPVTTSQLGTLENIPWRDVREASAPTGETVVTPSMRTQPAQTTLVAPPAVQPKTKPDDETLAAIRRALGMAEPGRRVRADANIIPAGETRQ